METCCATEECVHKSNACERHWEVAARACEGWKLEWTDPGPEVKVVHAIVPGPFEEPKVLKALPYKVVNKCVHCAPLPRDRRRFRNGIPDPWLEYLDAQKSREDDEESEVRQDAGLVKRCIRITDFVWHKKGLAMLQGIPDPWKPDLPCVCEIKKEPDNKKKKSHDKKVARRRSSTHERESPRRRISMNDEGTPRRKSMNEEESRGSTSANEEEPLRHRNANREEKSPSRRSSINEEFLKHHGSNKRGENTKRRSKNYDERPIRIQSKSEENIVNCAICYAAEPSSKTAYACYGGIVPACLSDYVVEQCPKRRTKRCEEKSVKWRSKRYYEEPVRRSSKRCDEEPVRRSSKKCDEGVPTKRRNKNYDKTPTKRRSRSYEIEIKEDCPKSCEKLAERRKKCRDERRTKSIRKNRSTSEDSSELSAEAPKKSRKRSDTTKLKVEKGKTCCGSGFEKVKQKLQELENELKAKEAAKDLKLREMEQLSKLRKKACKKKKRSGKVRKKFDDPAESMDKMRSMRKESTSPKGNYRSKDGEYLVHTGRIKTNEVKDVLCASKNSSCSNKNICRWLDEPGDHKKNLPKESSKSTKKTEAVHMISCQTKDYKTPQTCLKSTCKNTRAVSPQARTFTCAQPATLRSHSPCSTNPRRVSYTDESQPTCRTCTPYSPYHRRVSYSEEPQPPASRTSSPCRRQCEASYVDEPVTPRSNLSRCSHGTSVPGTSSIASQVESKESVKKFLKEINSRIEITQDALNSPCMKSVAVQPFREETTKTWHCPGRDLCPRMRERAGGDKGSELFVRRLRVDVVADEVPKDAVEVISKFNEDSDASDCQAGTEPAYRQPAYRRCSIADFKRRQREIEELFVESFSERDC